MDRQAVERALLAQVGKRLPEWDLFEPEHAFERVLGTVTWRVHLATQSAPRGLDVVVAVGVAHHRRGECVCNVGAELGALAGQSTRVFRLDDMTRVRAVAAQIAREIETTGLPFLTRFGNLAEVLRVFRSDPVMARRISSPALDHAAFAASLEAAWLVGA